ncbi:MAG: hypothetical protein OEY59_10580 [Deltaproteobacteria bacterium]|nr:hypothetical protein [Deltaproteobacteria bacterium]
MARLVNAFGFVKVRFPCLFPKRLRVAGLLLFGVCALSQNLSAQIATPAFDRTLRADMPAASGWRESSTVAVTAIQGTVKEKVANANSDMRRSEISYLVASHIIGPLYIESFKSLETRVTNSEELIRGTSFSSDPYPIEFQGVESYDRTQVNGALKFGAKNKEYITLGAHYFVVTKESSQQRTWGIKETIRDEQNGFGAGLSFRMGALYFAYGMESVTEKESLVKVGNGWDNQMFGVALMTDRTKSGNQFRLEYSKKVSVESEKLAEGVLIKNQHDKNSNSRFSLELQPSQFENWIINYEKQTLIESPIAQAQDINQEYETYGLIFRPKKGWIAGAYVISGTETILWPSSDQSVSTSTTSKSNYYRLNLGYSF